MWTRRRWGIWDRGWMWWGRLSRTRTRMARRRGREGRESALTLSLMEGNKRIYGWERNLWKYFSLMGAVLAVCLAMVIGASFFAYKNLYFAVMKKWYPDTYKNWKTRWRKRCQMFGVHFHCFTPTHWFDSSKIVCFWSNQVEICLCNLFIFVQFISENIGKFLFRILFKFEAQIPVNKSKWIIN